MKEFAIRTGISALVGLIALAAFLEYALWRADNYATGRIKSATESAITPPEDPRYKAALAEYERRKAIYDEKLKQGRATIEDWNELMDYYPLPSN